MRYGKLFLFAALFFGFQSFVFGQATCPPNVGFEDGNTSYWSFFVGTCCPISTPTATAALPRRHELTNGSAIDPHGLFPIVAPGGGSYSLKLGSDTINYCAERARYFVHVPSGSTNYSLVYRYAVVLNSGGHLPPGQPRFEVNVFDSASLAPVSCAQFQYVASDTGLPGFYPSFVAAYTSSTKCKNWTTSTINLTGLGGTTVQIDFSAGDCGYGGHFGYGYLDMSCGLFAISTVGCDTTSVNLVAPAGFHQYQWLDSADFSTVLDTNQYCTLGVPSHRTTYAVILIPYPGYGCRDTLYTHVIPSHLVVTKRSDTTVCFTGGLSVSLDLTATDIAYPLTYRWTPSATLSCDTCATPIAFPTAPTTYVYTVTDAGGCFQTDSIRINGNSLTSTLSTTNEPCFGDRTGAATINVTSARGSVNFRWTTSPPNYTNAVTSLAAGVYTCYVTDAYGCTGTQVATITQPAENIQSFTASSNPTTCFGHDGSITIGGFVPGSSDTISYNVAGVNHIVVLTANGAGQVNLTGLVSGSYDNFSVVTSGCPFNVIGPRVLADPPIPAPPAVVLQSYCQFETPAALSATGSNMLWYGPGVSGSTTAPVPSTAVAGIDSYFVTQTVAGCVSPRSFDPVIVTVKPAPPVVADTAYCQGARAAALTATGLNLRWYSDASATTLLTTAPTPTTTNVGSTTWYVNQKVNGCTSDLAPITATILYLPVFNIYQSRPYVCQHDTLTFAYNGPTLTDPGYSWAFSAGASVVTGSLTTSSNVVRFDSVFSQWVTLTASDYYGKCSSSESLKVKVIPMPTATSYIKGVICANDTTTIAMRDHTDNADHYKWDFDGANIVTANSNSGGPYDISWSHPGLYVIRLTAITVEGCEGKEVTDTVLVTTPPNASIYFQTHGTICIEDSLYLSAVDSNNFDNKFEWSPAHFFPQLDKPKVHGSIQDPGYVSLKVTDPRGCVSIDSVMIVPEECCKVYVPTAFKPCQNCTGLTATFKPLFANNSYHRYHEFRIVNRWGQTVFQTTNSDESWDGKFNGIDQDLGTFYYYIKYDCGGKTQEAHGDVTLIR